MNKNIFRGEEHKMFSASAEAKSLKYNTYVGKSKKLWLVADQLNCADNIYVEGPGGFSDRMITFKLVTGEELKLEGPWKSNSQSFFEDTGIDIRDNHLTYG